MELACNRESMFSQYKSIFNHSYLMIVFINMLFFSGYYVLKDPLAYMLYSNGITLKEAYSITTTASTLLALCSLFFGITLSNCSRQKHSLFIGIFFCTLAIGLLSRKNLQLDMLGIAFYVLGGGLYFFNIILLINKCFANTQDRIKGNYFYQILVNIGALIGCVLFLVGLKESYVFHYCFVSGLISLILFAFLYRAIDDGHFGSVNYFKFYSILFFLFFLIYIALWMREEIRWIVLISFLSTMVIVLYKAKKAKNRHLLLFIYLVSLFNIPYWIANTILFNQFIYFIMKDVSSFHGISSSNIIMIDPLVNALFGIGILAWFKNKTIHHYRNLSISSVLMLIAFIVLAIGLHFDINLQKINPIYPIVSMALFACSEFLLQTTLNSRIKDLLMKQNKNEYLATGIIRSSRAFASVVGYYLMVLCSQTTFIMKDEIRANFELYFIVVSIFLACYLIFAFYKKYNPDFLSG